MNIVLATDSADPSGVGHHMLTLGRELARSHGVVLVFSAEAAGSSFVEKARAAGLEAEALDMVDGAAFAQLIARGTPEVIHVHAGIGWEGQALADQGHAFGAAVVRTEHLPWLITDPEQEATYCRAAANVDAFVVVSDASAASWAPVLDRCRPDAPLATIRNGVAAPKLATSGATIRAALGVGAGEALLLCVARFTPQKDHPTLLEAHARLRESGHAVRLALVGEGPERAACEAKVRLAGIEGIAFLGTRDDVPDLLAAADALVLASRFEGLPLVVLEAMAAGLPVVATRIGGTIEALGSEHPFFCEPGDASDLTRTLEQALGSHAVADKCAAAQRRRFDRQFTAARMAAETERLYRSVIRAASSRRSKERALPRTRIGFVGCGGIALRHLGVLESFEDVEVVAAADHDVERTSGFAARVGAAAFQCHEEMLDACELDALWICLPPFAHGAPERAALARGLPFFVEKPLSLEVELAHEIDDAVRRSGLITAVGYHWRYLDTVDEARRLLADNPAHLMTGHWIDQTPPPEWWRRQEQSGGQMVEQATHVIDLARFLAGDIVEVYGVTSRRDRPAFPGLDVATASAATLRFASGAVATLSSTCILRWGHRTGLHVFSDALAIELSDHDIMVDVGRGRPTRPAEGDPVWREDRAFVDAVRGGENCIRTPYSEAVQTHLVALAVERSARLGRPLKLEGLRADPQPIFRRAIGADAGVA